MDNGIALAAFYGDDVRIRAAIDRQDIDLNERIRLCTPELESDKKLQDANLGYLTATLLILAVYGNRPDTVKLLLDAGCDPDATRAEDEKAALHVAAGVGSDEIVKQLLDSGASIDLVDSRGALPLSAACFYGHCGIVKRLIATGSPLQTKTKSDRPPLTAAVSGGRLEVAKLLLESKADPNVRSKDGATPLMLAAQERQVEMVKLLLKHKADPNVVSKRDRDTALKLASFGTPPELEIVELLLCASADPDIKDTKNKTPSDWAKDWGYEKVVELIDKHRKRRCTRDTSVAELAAPVCESRPIQGGFGLDQTSLNKLSQLFIRGRIETVTATLANACNSLRCVNDPKVGVEIGDGVPIVLVQQNDCEWTGLVELGIRSKRIFEFFYEPKVKELSDLLKTRVICVAHEGVSETTGYFMYENGRFLENMYASDKFTFKSEVRKLSQATLEDPDGGAVMDEFLKEQRGLAPLVPALSIENSNLTVQRKPWLAHYSVLVLKESLAGTPGWRLQRPHPPLK